MKSAISQFSVQLLLALRQDVNPFWKCASGRLLIKDFSYYTDYAAVGTGRQGVRG